jgi:hypothetical protein
MPIDASAIAMILQPQARKQIPMELCHVRRAHAYAQRKANLREALEGQLHHDVAPVQGL